MSLAQRLLVADAHRQIREETAGRIEVSEDSGESSSRSSGSDGRGDGSDGQRSSEGSGSEASSQVLRPSRMVHWRIRFDQMDCRPTIYHPGGIFEELLPLPPEALPDPWAEGQSWKNVFGTEALVSHTSFLLWSSGPGRLQLATSVCMNLTRRSTGSVRIFKLSVTNTPFKSRQGTTIMFSGTSNLVEINCWNHFYSRIQTVSSSFCSSPPKYDRVPKEVVRECSDDCNT